MENQKEMKQSLQEKQSELVNKYNEYTKLIKDTNAIIDDLESRTLKQKELKNYYTALSIQCENDYKEVTTQLYNLASDDETAKSSSKSTKKSE